MDSSSRASASAAQRPGRLVEMIVARLVTGLLLVLGPALTIVVALLF